MPYIFFKIEMAAALVTCTTPSQMAEETECSCQTYWDKDGDYEIGDHTCDKCLLEQDACGCSQTERCHLCEIRTPSPPTVADKEHADTNLAGAREVFRKEHADWHAKNEAGTLEEDPHYCLADTYGAESAWAKDCACRKCIFSGSAELDFTLKRDRQRLREGVGVDDEHDYYEMAHWYESWANKTPAHLDPSAWRFHDTLRLSWAARKLQGI